METSAAVAEALEAAWAQVAAAMCPDTVAPVPPPPCMQTFPCLQQCLQKFRPQHLQQCLRLRFRLCDRSCLRLSFHRLSLRMCCCVPLQLRTHQPYRFLCACLFLGLCRLE